MVPEGGERFVGPEETSTHLRSGLSRYVRAEEDRHQKAPNIAMTVPSTR